KKTGVKVPRSLNLPAMKDYHLFHRRRLVQIQDNMLDRLKELKVRSIYRCVKITCTESGAELPQDPEELMAMLLGPEPHAERKRLLSQGFGSWTKNNFTDFTEGVAKHGKDRLDLVAATVGKPVEEVERYSQTFWRIGQGSFPPEAWERVMQKIERGERKLAEVGRFSYHTSGLLSAVNNPWSRLELRHKRRAGEQVTQGMHLQREWTADEDRYLLCFSHL
ncbi:unnamed protein product, partial [Discosporangium mesarthrocarpum]